MVHDAYLRHARDLDSRYHPQGGRPIEARLGTFGKVRGFIFGAYGEASTDVHDLLSQAARRMADNTWEAAGAIGPNEMYAFYMQQMRKRIGMASVLAMARHRLNRVPAIGVPRQAIEQHMQRARAQVRGRDVSSSDLTEFYAFQVNYQSGVTE
jgi:hypothetical protein